MSLPPLSPHLTPEAIRRLELIEQTTPDAHVVGHRRYKNTPQISVIVRLPKGGLAEVRPTGRLQSLREEAR